VRVGALCAGYGGLELGLGIDHDTDLVWYAENDPAPASVMAAHWPGVPNLGDLTVVDWTQVEPVDVLTAGYPCQPFSHAGKRKGSKDERHVWPHIAAGIRVLRPRRVLLENVRGHLSLGFGRVLGDLADLGYDTRWMGLRAADVGAPHGRSRIFIVAAERGAVAPAYADGNGLEGIGRLESVRRDADRCGGADVAWGKYEPAIFRWEHILGRPAPAPTERGRNGPRLSPRFVEWLMGLPAGWVTDVDIPRNAQLKALGNGVVPQQAALALSLLEVGETL
jgi:DNA (cytosine-5)-methyltransferase 1